MVLFILLFLPLPSCPLLLLSINSNSIESLCECITELFPKYTGSCCKVQVPSQGSASTVKLLHGQVMKLTFYEFISYVPYPSAFFAPLLFHVCFHCVPSFGLGTTSSAISFVPAQHFHLLPHYLPPFKYGSSWLTGKRCLC